MKIPTWNCQGAGNQDFATNFREIVREHHPHVVYVIETRVFPAHADIILPTLGFSDWLRAPTNGMMGGIWLLWNSVDTDVELLHMDDQAIHALINRRDLPSWAVTGVYAQPRKEDKARIFNKLEDFAKNMDTPWLVTGDFNEIQFTHEKLGGNVASVRRCQAFNHWIERCELSDLGFQGPKYTWDNKRDGAANIKERIDRALANEAWCKLFPNNAVLHLPRTYTDDLPVLTCCYGLDDKKKARPFRFEKAWLMNGECKGIIEDIWKQNSQVVTTIAQVPELIVPWNKNKFGNIFHRKRKLLGRLEGIQRALGQYHSSFLVNLEKELIRDYNMALKQEEMFWFQKSRIKWIMEGESNTKFFHHQP